MPHGKKRRQREKSVPFDRNRMIGLAALAGALGCWAFAAANAEVAGMTKEEADSLIYERQQVMSDMDKQGELIGSIVAGEDLIPVIEKVAQTGNMNGVIELLVEAMPCKECHDIYRIPKKKPAA